MHISQSFFFFVVVTQQKRCQGSAQTKKNKVKRLTYIILIMRVTHLTKEYYAGN